MKLFEVKASIEKIHSDKKNKDYYTINVPLSSDYTYTIFAQDAQLAIIKKSDFLDIKEESSNNDLRPEDFA